MTDRLRLPNSHQLYFGGGTAEKKISLKCWPEFLQLLLPESGVGLVTGSGLGGDALKHVSFLAD